MIQNSARPMQDRPPAQRTSDDGLARHTAEVSLSERRCCGSGSECTSTGRTIGRHQVAATGGSTSRVSDQPRNVPTALCHRTGMSRAPSRRRCRHAEKPTASQHRASPPIRMRVILLVSADGTPDL